MLVKRPPQCIGDVCDSLRRTQVHDGVARCPLPAILLLHDAADRLDCLLILTGCPIPAVTMFQQTRHPRILQKSMSGSWFPVQVDRWSFVFIASLCRLAVVSVQDPRQSQLRSDPGRPIFGGPWWSKFGYFHVTWAQNGLFSGFAGSNIREKNRRLPGARSRSVASEKRSMKLPYLCRAHGPIFGAHGLKPRPVLRCFRGSWDQTWGPFLVQFSGNCM